MLISEMMETLQKLKNKHGDLPVLMVDSIGLHFKLGIDCSKLYTGEEFIFIGKKMDQCRKNLRPFIYEDNKK